MLNQTPTEKLEVAHPSRFSILDGVLWFLRLDNVLVNGDGYWTQGQ